MSVPGNQMFGGVPPISGTLSPEMQAQILKARLALQNLLPVEQPPGVQPPETLDQARERALRGPTAEMQNPPPSPSPQVLDMLTSQGPVPQAPVPAAVDQVLPLAPPPPGMAGAPQPPPTPIQSASQDTGRALLPQSGQDLPNPFMDAQGPPLDNAPPTNEGQQVVPAHHEERKKGWHAFIEKVKTDPNMRMALLQMAIGLTKPAGSAQEGIGNALEAGMKTLSTLDNRNYERARQQQADKRDERQVANTERQTTNQAGQFSQKMELDRKQFEDQLQQTRDTREYQREMLNIRRIEADNKLNTEGGQVNSRIKMVKDGMLKNAANIPLLAGITDAQERDNKAGLMAFMAVKGAGNDRAKFVANAVQNAIIYAPDPAKDAAKYNTYMRQAFQQANDIADEAGFTSDAETLGLGATAPPTNQPAQAGQPAPAPAPQPATLPKVGEVRGGYRFKGGTPSDPNSWEKV